ncbi:MAG: hypothetical protein ACOYXA_07220 [Bacteroidota bacterium]
MQAITLQKNNSEKRITLVVVFWGLTSFLLGYYGFFNLIPNPLFGAIVVLILSSLILHYQLNDNFKQFCNKIPLKAIALFHVWRIFAGWIFLSYSGVLSETFINNAAYGDIISGFFGLSVFLFGHSKLNYYIFNIVGLLDFIVAVGTGITLTILGNEGMTPIIQLPLIMIPLFGVPLSGFTHFISISRLLQMKNNKLTDIIE